MNSGQLIIHAQKSINSQRVLTKIISGQRHIKYYNSFLIPFQCNKIDNKTKIIDGDFLYPILNVLHRAILTKNNNFNYSSIRVSNYMFEYHTHDLMNYHIYSNYRIYPNYISLNTTLLSDNSLLLFNIDGFSAKTLIEYNLM